MSISYDISSYKSYNDLIEVLERNAITFKGELLKLDDEFEISSSTNKVNFKNLIVLCILSRELVLFPDEVSLNKFRKLGLIKATLKWFVRFEDILNEIDRLDRIEGLKFDKIKSLLLIEAHLSTSIRVSVIEQFTPTGEYKKSQSNIIHKDFVDRFRRMNSKKRKINIQNCTYEDPLDMVMSITESRIIESNVFRNYMLKTSKGGDLFLEELLSIFEIKGISKSKVYEELFPLISMIDKKRNYLGQSEFNNKNEIYDGNYRVYKIAKVRKVLSKSSRES